MTDATHPLRLRPEAEGDVTLSLYPAADDGEAVSDGERGGVLVLPGGGHGVLADHESEPIARAWNARGFDAAVLRYRLGSAGHRHPRMLQDARLALLTVRQHPAFSARRWAILGFSAGGHLASTLLVHHDQDLEPGQAADPAARPDAGILCYPVIEMEHDARRHAASRDNLLGHDAPEALRRQLSTWRHVSPQTPPTFLWHTADDAAVPMSNSLQFAQACRDAGVPTELHVYESGRHGLGLGEGTAVEGWFDLACAFLQRHLRQNAARPSAEKPLGRRSTPTLAQPSPSVS